MNSSFKNIIALFLGFICLLAFPENVISQNKTIPVSHIKVDMSTLGRTFEGFGALSAGASSRLLIDYPEPYRSDILDFLFKPKFGASLQHFKFEIGGDMNSTCGTEPSHARTRDEMLYPKKEYFSRGYEYWMAVEAKKRNPEMIFDALQWGAPGWFDGGFYSQDNADYVASYVKGMKKYFGIDIRYCGLWNEKHIPGLSRDYVVNNLRPTLDRKGLKNVKIVGNDMYCNYEQNHIPWSYVDEMLNDEQLRKAIGILGYHYIDGQSPQKARDLGIPIWESEASIGTGNWEKAYDFARLSNLNYIRGKVTKAIVWNPIDAYYANLNHHHYGVMQANSPWSGHYVIRPAVWALAHTTQFTDPGWIYVDSGCGITESGSPYVTLTENKKGDNISIIIVTASKKETFRISTGNKRIKELAVWKSNEKEQFVKQPPVLSDNQEFFIDLDASSIYTITTTKGQQKGIAVNPIPQEKTFPKNYVEDFESYRLNQTPRYITDQGGVFEVKEEKNNKGNKVLQQVITNPLICWDEWGPNNPEPFTEFGEKEYADYEVSVDFLIEEKGTAKLFGHVPWFESNTAPHGIGIFVDEEGDWQYIEDQTPVMRGKANINRGKWNSLKLIFKAGNTKAYINNDLVAECPTHKKYLKGLAGIGCDWNRIQFDNLKFNIYE